MLESDAIESFKFLQKKVIEWQPNLPQVGQLYLSTIVLDDLKSFKYLLLFDLKTFPVFIVNKSPPSHPNIIISY